MAKRVELGPASITIQIGSKHWFVLGWYSQSLWAGVKLSILSPDPVPFASKNMIYFQIKILKFYVGFGRHG